MYQQMSAGEKGSRIFSVCGGFLFVVFFFNLLSCIFILFFSTFIWMQLKKLLSLDAWKKCGIQRDYVSDFSHL